MDVLNEREAAEVIGISTLQLRRLREEGRAPAHWRVGKRGVRYRRTVVLEWCERGGTAQETAVGQ